MIAKNIMNLSCDGTSYFEDKSDYRKGWSEMQKAINKRTKKEHDLKKLNGHLYITDENGDAICSVNSNFALENFILEGKPKSFLDHQEEHSISKQTREAAEHMRDNIELKQVEMSLIMEALKTIVQFKQAGAIPDERKFMFKSFRSKDLIEVLRKMNITHGYLAYGHLDGAYTQRWFEEMGTAYSQYLNSRQ